MWGWINEKYALVDLSNMNTKYIYLFVCERKKMLKTFPHNTHNELSGMAEWWVENDEKIYITKHIQCWNDNGNESYVMKRT
jgi:hypothetical protein